MEKRLPTDSDEEEEKPKNKKSVTFEEPPKVDKSKSKGGEKVVLTKEQKDELSKEKKLNKDINDIKKGKGDEAILAEAARLAEIRRRREEAAKDKEEEDRKLEEARLAAEQAKKTHKKK